MPARSKGRRRRPRRRPGPPPVSASHGECGRLPCRAEDWPSWLRTATARAPPPSISHRRRRRTCRPHPSAERRGPRRLDQTTRHVRIERVAPIGTVHGDGEQAGLEFLEDDVVVHEVLLSLLLDLVIARSVATKQSSSWGATNGLLRYARNDESTVISLPAGSVTIRATGTLHCREWSPAACSRPSGLWIPKAS